MRSTWLLLAVLGSPAVARAAPPAAEPAFSATIAYRAPAGCPSAEAFKVLVAGRLGFDPFSDDARDHVLVSIDKGATSLEGRLEWRDREGQWAGDRTFTAHTADCDELARAMGFALAVQINLLATERAPSAEQASPRGETAATAPGANAAHPAPPATPDAHAAKEVETRTGPSRRRSGVRPAFGVGAGAGVALGMSPGAAGLVRLFASAAAGPWAIELGGELSTKTVEERSDGAGYAQRFFLGSAAGCWEPDPLGLCVVMKAGVVDVDGRDIDVPASPSGAAVELGARVKLRQHLGRAVFVAERLDALFNVTRWRVTLDQIPVWTAPVAAGTLGLDVGAVF